MALRREIRGIKFSQSIIFKSILLLIVSMTLIVNVSTYFYAKRQSSSTLEWYYHNNDTHVQQMLASAINEMEQFESRLTLFSKTSEVKSMDPVVSAGYLKSYTVSSLFISGETISLFDRKDSLVSNNSMVGNTEISYPVDFASITPHRPYHTPWYRDEDSKPPQRAFATVVSDRAAGDGSLVATFSFRRLWKDFSEQKVGKNGFFIAISDKGEILYHPDLKSWLNGPHKIAELGFEDFDPKTYETDEIVFKKLKNDTTYLVSYSYNPAYDLGLFALQPKKEIDENISSVKIGSMITLVCSIIAILFISVWMYFILGVPINRVISHIFKITEGNLDIQELPEGKKSDEIGQLSKAINIMHGTIKRQIKELKAHRELLEQEVRERTLELEKANKKLDQISRTDELTELPNRRDMLNTIDHEMDRVARNKNPFCFIFIDIDHFKNINDTYGHSCGDLVLKTVAQTIRGLLRKYDVVARYGGEEFLTLLPETDLEGATIVAERFRKKVEDLSIQYAEYTIKVTITLGVARFDCRLGANHSIQLADRALYEGKESGRNKVVVWDPKRTTETDYKNAAIEKAANPA